MKTCTVCGAGKPLDEFPAHKQTKDRLYPYCRECKSARAKAWRAKNPTAVTTIEVVEKACTKCEKVKPISDFYKDKRAQDGHKTACKACHYQENKASIAKNPTASIAKGRRWRENNPERSKEVNSRSHQKHRAERYAKNRDWIKANRKRHAANQRIGSANYKARKRGAEGNYTAADIEYLFAEQCGVCPVCGSRLADGYHVDHIVPLVAGGSNWPQNLQLLCPPCNHKKNAMPMENFLELRKVL